MVTGNSFDASSPPTGDGSPVGHGLPRWKGMATSGLPKPQDSSCLTYHVYWLS